MGTVLATPVPPGGSDSRQIVVGKSQSSAEEVPPAAPPPQAKMEEGKVPPAAPPPQAKMEEGMYFWLLPVRELMALPDDEPMPRHQELLKEGKLARLMVTMADVVTGKLREDTAAISHRWLDPEHIDPNGDKLRKLKSIMRTLPSIKYVWLDWACAPQKQGGVRTEEEKREFEDILNNILSYMYLGATVIVLWDRIYNQRFWPNVESWTAMKTPTPEGLKPSTAETTRAKFFGILSADGKDKEVQHTMLEMWHNSTAEQAVNAMKGDDILVTNKKDKETNLKVIASLNDHVRGLFPQEHAHTFSMDGDYFSFKTGGNPEDEVAVDRFRLKRRGLTVTLYRSQSLRGPAAGPGDVKCESFAISGASLTELAEPTVPLVGNPSTGTVQPDGDIVWSSGETSRRSTIQWFPGYISTREIAGCWCDVEGPVCYLRSRVPVASDSRSSMEYSAEDGIAETGVCCFCFGVPLQMSADCEKGCNWGHQGTGCCCALGVPCPVHDDARAVRFPGTNTFGKLPPQVPHRDVNAKENLRFLSGSRTATQIGTATFPICYERKISVWHV